MKKFLALILAALLVLSMGVAFAAEGDVGAVDTTTWHTGTSTWNGLKKIYTVTTGEAPMEELTFKVEADSTNPANKDHAGNAYPADVTVDKVTVDQSNLKEKTYPMTVHLPDYWQVGVYRYTITETPPLNPSQGVTYDPDSIGIAVLVQYNYTDGKMEVADVYLTTPLKTEGEGEGEGEGEASADVKKKDTFDNIYKFGGDDDGTDSLQVSKTVTGNLGDKSKYFEMTVTLTATKTVNSEIVYHGGKYEGEANQVTIPAGWTGAKPITIELKDGDTVHFDKIPDGVTFTVVESNYTTGGENSEDGYDAPKYEVNGTEVESVSGTIENQKKPVVAVTNNKDSDITTGITLETLPYVLVLGIVLAGVALMIARRRRSNEE